MTITRSIRLMSMTFAVAVASTWLAPAALAGPLDGVQNTTSDAVNGTTNAVSNVTDPVVDTVTGTTGGATNTVTETSGGVTNTVTETTGGATNPVSDVVDSVNESAGGNPGGVVDQAKDTVHGVSTGATSDLGSTVHNPLGGAGNGGVGSLLQDPGLIDQKDQSNVPGSAGGTIHGHTVDAASETEASGTADSVLGLHVDGFVGSKAITGTATDRAGSMSARASFWQAAADAATQAAKQFAFPLLLLVIVVAFLTLQGRVGRKDPKLALAPVEADHDSLVFE